MLVSCIIPARDSSDAFAVTESDSSLLPAVIALAVLTVILISVASVAIYCYCKVKKASKWHFKRLKRFSIK